MTEDSKKIKANALARKRYYASGGCSNPIRKNAAKRYVAKHKEKIKQYSKDWYESHKADLMEKARIRYNKKYQIEPLYRLKATLCSGINTHLKRYNKTKTDRTLAYLGTTLSNFKEHLEQQFVSEMNWNNYGSVWHVDHIIPFNYFKQNNLDYKLCSHFTNLQPLMAEENVYVKSDEIVKPYLHKIIAHPDTPGELLDVALALASY